VTVGAPELDLDLETFEGPFDLLLTLILKEELRLAEVDVADIVRSFADRLAQQEDPPAAGQRRERIDLEACGEFLVLVGALLEIKARELFPDADAHLGDLSPEEAAEELAQRLAEYRRIKAAAAWLSARLEAEGDRYFRLGPAPLAPRPELRLAPQDPLALAAALRGLAAEAPGISLEHMQLHFPPVARFLERFRSLLRRRSRFGFDEEVARLGRLEQASAFLALLELRKRNELSIEQESPFGPIGVARLDVERSAA
jgi:segregation and condensation protein A